MKFSADLVTFTEEILNGKLHFLSSVYIVNGKWRAFEYLAYDQKWEFHETAKDKGVFGKCNIYMDNFSRRLNSAIL